MNLTKQNQFKMKKNVAGWNTPTPSFQEGCGRKQAPSSIHRILPNTYTSGLSFPSCRGRAVVTASQPWPGLALEGPGQEKTAREEQCVSWGRAGDGFLGIFKGPAMLGTHSPTLPQPSRAAGSMSPAQRGQEGTGPQEAWWGWWEGQTPRIHREGPGNKLRAKVGQTKVSRLWGAEDPRGSGKVARDPDTEVVTYQLPPAGAVPTLSVAQAGISAPAGGTPPDPTLPQEAKPSQLRIYWRKCNHIKT